MRLLSREGNVLSFSNLQHDNPQPYAILSHTWAGDNDEVTFEDVINGTAADKLGYQKLDFCLEQAKQDGYHYVWIDTCCIDKRDRNELGEAINRMMQWYHESEVCYVYLSDLTLENWETKFTKSRWHTRGWTLQELVAPSETKFYTRDRQYLGDRTTLHKQILEATAIDTREALSDVPFSRRYEWSLKRQTTKPEDLSYCMVGLLEVSLVFNYGESPVAARERLLQAVEEEHGRKVGRQIRKIRSDWDARPKPNDMILSTFGQMNIARLMNALKFVNMNARRETIVDPYPSTCTWLLEHESFRAWLAGSTKPFLWIKGRPGAGKSTLIKYTESQSAGRGVQIDFFFNARGDELERSAAGMYRSLLYQLVDKISWLADPVLGHLEQYRKYTGRPWTMTTTNVKTVIQFVVAKLEKPVWCFIDALDECPVAEVKEMLQYFEELTMGRKLFFICLASRYYPTVTIRNAIEIHLERKEQDADLERYVDGRLAIDGYGAEGQELKATVLKRANGIFFWLVLVVKLLNDELDNGSIWNVQKRLDELPDGLSALIHDIVVTPGGLDELRICLQWLLFAKRPLLRGEYYLAVLSGLRELGIMTDTTWNKLAFDKRTTTEQMDKFITSTSRGLARVTASEDGTETVQLVHESVRDYFLYSEGLKQLWPDATHLKSEAHDDLKRICCHCLSDGALYHGHALIDYVQDYLFQHAEEAAEHISQVDFLGQSAIWTNVMSRRQTTSTSRLIYHLGSKLNIQWSRYKLLAEFHTPRLIYTLHREDKAIGHFKQPRLLWALDSDPTFQNVNPTLEALLDCGANIDSLDDNGQPVLFHCISKDPRSVTTCSLLLKRGANVEIRGTQGRTSLILAAEIGSEEHVKLLLEAGAKTEAKDSSGATALTIALASGSEGIITLLRAHGANIDSRNEAGETALVTACKQLSWQGTSKLVTSLLEQTIDVDACDGSGRTALMIASEKKCTAIVKEILAKGVNKELRDRFGRTALLLACTPGPITTAAALLEAGANADSAFLDVCKWHGAGEMIKLLLSHRADVQLRDEQGRTALMLAVRHSRLDNVKQLIEHGVPIEGVDNDGHSIWNLAEKKLAAVAIAYDPVIKEILIAASPKAALPIR